MCGHRHEEKNKTNKSLQALKLIIGSMAVFERIDSEELEWGAMTPAW
jgi:hypothetical protein